MRATEIRALGEVAAEGVTVLHDIVRGMHTGIASRVFTSVGPAARPVEVIHDVIAQAVHTAIGTAGQRVPEAVGVLAATRFDDDTPIDRTPAVAEAIAALNGIYGDELASRGNALATTMAVRVDGRPVDPASAPLAEAFPDATNRLVVFVHGLCQTESSWRRAPRPAVDAPDPRPYGARLRDDLGFTPVHVRYNTGLHISSNGHSLDELLAALTEAWPVPVCDIALVGHSMGGLVVAQCLSLRRGGGSRLGLAGAPGGVPGLTASGRRPRKGRQRRVVGAGPVTRNTRPRRVSQPAQRRHQGSALRRLPGRRLGRGRPRRVPA
ncbi:esterase/lipase family protein [Mycolicibacterium monacense]|uniref:esterase/lipase family protein n=1 Tax=Mycolicibacterium monacense TaxID=85693 RepID=UPI001F1A4F31|nr:alpha/beta fold hydrolase [Mycolicibacterium monacense]